MAKEDLIYDALKRSEVVAFLLWFFFGILGAHRFYLKRIGSGVLMLVLTCTVFGMVITGIWWIIDAFLIVGMTKEYNLNLIERTQNTSPDVKKEPTL